MADMPKRKYIVTMDPPDGVPACGYFYKQNATELCAQLNLSDAKHGWLSLHRNPIAVWFVIEDKPDEDRVVFGPNAKKTDDRWNGTCGRCSKRTYTGFVNVEHENGKCG